MEREGRSRERVSVSRRLTECAPPCECVHHCLDHAAAESSAIAAAPHPSPWRETIRFGVWEHFGRPSASGKTTGSVGWCPHSVCRPKDLLRRQIARAQMGPSVCEIRELPGDSRVGEDLGSFREFTLQHLHRERILDHPLNDAFHRTAPYWGSYPCSASNSRASGVSSISIRRSASSLCRC